MSEKNPGIPASWVLNEKVKATVLAVNEGRTDLLIERLQGPGAAVLSLVGDRMLTNGTDVDVSDDFPAYLGLFDQFSEIGEHVKVGDSVVMDDENLIAEDTESFMGLAYQVDILARRMAGVYDVPSTVSVLNDLAHAIEFPGDIVEDSSPIPFEGQLDEALTKMLRDMICAALVYGIQDVDWDSHWNQRLVINPDNTWIMPGTFGSDTGRWEFTSGRVVITMDDPDADLDGNGVLKD